MHSIVGKWEQTHIIIIVIAHGNKPTYIVIYSVHCAEGLALQCLPFIAELVIILKAGSLFMLSRKR